MVLTIFDIPRLLHIIKLYDKEKFASRSYVQQTFNDEPVRQAKLPNYEEVEKFCKELKLLGIESEKIFLTKLGNKILEHYNKVNNDNEEFKEIFIKESLFDTEIGEKIRASFSKFYVGENQNRWCPKWEIYDLFETPEILPILYELDILEKKDTTVEINTKYFQIIKKSQKKITQDQLEKQLQNWKITGDIGEEIVLIFEKNRLKKEGHITESEKVERISDENANAGYDIESFLEHQGNMHEIYIEVKASTEKEFAFYWSANELEKAKEYGEKYWIYFVPEIDVKTRSSPREPIKIQNPAETIFKDQSFKTEIEKYHITKIDSS